MRRAAGWIAGIALVAAAAAVGGLELDESQTQAPFEVRAAVGERAEGRDIAVTVADVRAADHVSDGRGWEADGTWVVVDLEVEAVRSERGALLGLAMLDLGDRRIEASERPESLLDTSLAVGLPRSGSLAFELPPGARTGTATLRIGRSAEVRLDSLIALEMDLDALEAVAETELLPTGWAR